MAITALNVYAAVQNGNTEFTRLPDDKQIHSGQRIPEWVVGCADKTTQIVLQKQSPPAVIVEIESASATVKEAPIASNPTHAKVSLNDLVTKYKQEWNNLAPGTRIKMNCHFIVSTRYLNFDRALAGIKLADLRELKSKLSEGRKPTSVNDILFKVMGALFKIALEDEIIDRSPLERLARARRGEMDRQQPTWESLLCQRLF
jgi:hypothetical protein